MERFLRQGEIQKGNLFLQSFAGVLEALAVFLFSLVHCVVIRVLRRSGLSTPCACAGRIRKRIIMPGLGYSGGVEGSSGHLSPKKASASVGFAVESGIAMAAQQSGYSTPAEGLSQREIDNDQDVKDRELFQALFSERETLAALYSELEQERNCAASAAREALAMISRLQEEKAAVQLEARQFQRMVLEKAMYDQEAIEALNELLVSREEEKLALEEEICACRERLDAVMREERRQSLATPEAEPESLPSPIITESPILPIEKEKMIATPGGAGREERSECVDKFSTSKSQVLTALVRDSQLGLGRKEPEEKPEFPGFVSLRRRWRSQEVSLKTLEQTREERQIEERRIEERRLSVLEYVMKFEQQQQQEVRLPVRMQSVTRLPKSAENPSPQTRAVDIDGSARKDERALTRDDSLRRRLFEEEDCSEEEQKTTEAVTDECVEKALLVHDVYEVQKSPYEAPVPVVTEPQPATPSDRLGKPDLPTSFETDDCLCLIHPPTLDPPSEEENNDDLQWEDLQGKVRYKTLRVSKSLRIRDDARSEVDEEVHELTQRLQALEADRFFMKQTIESLRRENGEMKLLQGLAHQFHELEDSQQESWPQLPRTLQFQISSNMSERHHRRNSRAPSRARALCRVESPASTITGTPSWNALDPVDFMESRKDHPLHVL